ncbi:carboxylesterase [Aquicoccus porphyridii]|uniref:Carboxylesterase n=1 Tax=Aquicoccus porphyridii TaxID=1852029 RepID=A0A5A9ZVJ6_9RHOB|nr:holin family protein [Aquicoccus porphyridii]KAA0920872.1 carboxylesterase [Aquicoccus porphyridii]RAI56586.1 carboxylesterase [Rhodobacteraceae bacterium AsT-22]
MGLIERIVSLVFGDGGRGVKNTVEVFRENAEAAGIREGEMRAKAMAQFGSEFAQPRKGLFDRMIDGLNRLPRPALAFGTLGLFIAAMVDPIWFASRMQGIALVPEPLWWLLGAIVSFYFGARHQAKGQEFQRQIGQSLAAVPKVLGNLERLEHSKTAPGGIGMAGAGTDARLDLAIIEPEANPALSGWRRGADIGR